MSARPRRSQIAIGRSQVQFFGDNGYLRLDVLTTQKEVAEIRAELQQLFEIRAGEKEGAFADLVAGADHPNILSSPQILNPVNYAPKLHQTQCFKNALSIAKQLLGDEARCFFDLSILKKPKGGAATPWHQDEAFRDPNFEYNELTIWVALQAVPRKAGACNSFPDRTRGRFSNITQRTTIPRPKPWIAATSWTRPRRSRARSQPGGCTIHHPRTFTVRRPMCLAYRGSPTS